MPGKKQQGPTLSYLKSTASTPCDKSCIDTIKIRQTDELVIALCGAIGSGTSTVGDLIEDILHEYGYETKRLRLSDYIKKCSREIVSDIKFHEKPLSEKYNILQTEGNNLRDKFSNDILSQLAIYDITGDRIGFDEIANKDTPDIGIHHIRRHATIIDSLKHPEEWRLLKTVYGSMFYLFGVLCPANIRKTRLIIDKRIDDVSASQLIERDKSEAFDFGQQFIKTVYNSDFFIRNIASNKTKLATSLRRYIELILGENKLPPTLHEYAMHAAQSSAHRSSCLSRQVGAAIVSSSGEIIASGRNDAPKFGGGLYSTGDASDQSCVHTNGCTNYRYKNLLSDEIRAVARRFFPDSTDESLSSFIAEIKNNTRLKDLIEYSKAVHAEMDAIITVARTNAHGLIDATMYCTTFPCHHCARHIIASGIKKVFYIEPYEKSLAHELHQNEIALDSDDLDAASGKVEIIPFEGVAPKQFMNLFRDRDKKMNGQRIKVNLKEAKPMSEQLMDSFTEYETKVVDLLRKTDLFKEFYPESSSKSD